MIAEQSCRPQDERTLRTGGGETSGLPALISASPPSVCSATVRYSSSGSLDNSEGSSPRGSGGSGLLGGGTNQTKNFASSTLPPHLRMRCCRRMASRCLSLVSRDWKRSSQSMARSIAFARRFWPPLAHHFRSAGAARPGHSGLIRCIRSTIGLGKNPWISKWSQCRSRAGQGSTTNPRWRIDLACALFW